MLATSDNLPTRGNMIESFINLALNLAPKIHQKSIQEAPKIDCRGHREQDASWHGIWNPLGEDFDRFWIQLGRQVGTKLPPKSIKHRSKNEDEEASENYSKSRAAKLCPGFRGGSLKTTESRDFRDHTRH